jgi:nucleotide-binding universal stress UspA family protein
MAEPTRVIVGISAHRSDRAALRKAAAEARSRGAMLVAVASWAPANGEHEYRRRPVPGLLEACEQAARERLDDAFTEALDGYPTDLDIQPVLLRTEHPGRALEELAEDQDALLVVGGGRLGRLSRGLRGSLAAKGFSRPLPARAVAA